MRIDRDKVNLILAEKKITVSELCDNAGFHRTRYYTILNSRNILPRTVGRIADVLGVKPSEIIEEEGR